MPISSDLSPVFSIALFRAISAATSTGGFRGSSRGISVGYLTRIILTIVGQAVL